MTFYNVILAALVEMLGKGSNVSPSAVRGVVVTIEISRRGQATVPVIRVAATGGEEYIQERAIYDVDAELVGITRGQKNDLCPKDHIREFTQRDLP
jgi:hypothetical protein